MVIPVTGAGGLIGSEVVSYFSDRAQSIIRIDNNMRADFFGPEGDTRRNIPRLESLHSNFGNYQDDIRKRSKMLSLFCELPIDVVVHCAAQPSHDLAAKRPGVYSIFGYQGKQVTDNIHSHDVVRAIDCYLQNPRPGEVYNLGGQYCLN